MDASEELESRANPEMPPCFNCGHEAHAGAYCCTDGDAMCECHDYSPLTFEDVLERENSETI